MMPNLKKLPINLMLVCALAAAFPASRLTAETCLSPYIKGLKAPAKVMYLWALPAMANGGPDYLAVIDVNLASPTYGKILKKVFVGTSGNEAHHMGFTDDRRYIWAGGLAGSDIFVFDIGTDPAKPVLIKTISTLLLYWTLEVKTSELAGMPKSYC